LFFSFLVLYKSEQSQQRRIHELERINIDLERRLEQQARERMKLERESVENKRLWEAQHADIGRVCEFTDTL
jgi:predicted RNase H-like nuclease (RuvC/YqgF family)